MVETFPYYVKIPKKKRNIRSIRRYLSNNGLCEYKNTRNYETHYWVPFKTEFSKIYFKYEHHKVDFEQWLFQNNHYTFCFEVKIPHEKRNDKDKKKEIKEFLLKNNIKTFNSKGDFADCHIDNSFKAIHFKNKETAVLFKLKMG